MRNATCTTIAPTGTIGIIAGCSGGIEPIFSFATKRRVLDGQEFVQLHPLIEKLGTKRDWLTDNVRDLLSKGVPPCGIPDIPRKLADVLVIAHEVPPERHVEIHLHRRSKAKKKTSEEDRTDLKNYMHAALVKAIQDSYKVVYRPGPGVARARVALTDIKKAEVLLNIHPASKIMGAGLGGASLEAELVDSQTGEQIAALVESQLGDRLSLDGWSTWGDAKAIMDGWAARFRERLDEAHGRL